MANPLLMLGWGFLTGLNPIRLAFALLVVSRPRPMQSLLAYWLGSLTAGTVAVLIPLMVMQVTPVLRNFTHDLATPGTSAGSTVQHIRFGIGVLILAAAALMTARSLTRRRQQAHLPTSGGKESTLATDPGHSPAILRFFGRTYDAATEGGSPIRRLMLRLRNAWENGSLWVAFVMGIAFGGVEPDVAIFLLTVIFASGATVSTQFSSAIAFIIGILGIIEITLASHVVTPAKTQVIVERLHDWALNHRRKIMITMCTVGGVALVANNMGW